jgi:membrane protease YdiL (CAAX protease family)
MSAPKGTCGVVHSWPSNSSKPAAVITGLTVAWGGTALLVSALARGLSDPSRLANALVGQALFWALAAAVVAIVLFWERQPLRSFWLQRFRWQSITWGLLLVAAYYTVLFPLGEWVRRSAGLPGFGAGMEQVIRFPVWYRIVAVVGAGIGEEVLFRGVQRHANRDAHREHPARSCRHPRRIPFAACTPMGVGFCAWGSGQWRCRHGVLYLA